MSDAGIIYLLQPAQLIMLNGYKIGYTLSDDFRRFNSYHCGSKLIYAIRCKNVIELEKELKKKLPTKFKLLSGRKYFTCVNDELSEMFLNITMEHIKNPNTTKKTMLQKNNVILNNNSNIIKLSNNKNKNNTQNTNVIQKNTNIPNNSESSIINSSNSTNSMEELNNNIFKCNICNISLCSITSYRNHCRTNAHIKNLGILRIQQQKKNIKLQTKALAESHNESFKCNYCDKLYCNKGNLTRHKKTCAEFEVLKEHYVKNIDKIINANIINKI